MHEAPGVAGATEAAVERWGARQGQGGAGLLFVGVSVRGASADALRSVVQRCPQSEQHRDVSTYSYVKRAGPMLSVLTAKK